MDGRAAFSCWMRRAWPRPSLPPATPICARAVERAGYPFSLGVASGSPLPDSVILWTRILPDPLDAIRRRRRCGAAALGSRARTRPSAHRREGQRESPRRSWRTACA
jgi:hypothetical protein